MPIPIMLTILQRFRDHEKKPQRMIFSKTLSDISLALYFLSDHPLYFQRIGFAKFDKEFVSKVDYWNNIFWLLNCIFDIMGLVVDLHHVQKEIQNLVISLNLPISFRNPNCIRKCMISKRATFDKMLTMR